LVGHRRYAEHCGNQRQGESDSHWAPTYEN
jgi:hypothetical protein